MKRKNALAKLKEENANLRTMLAGAQESADRFDRFIQAIVEEVREEVEQIAREAAEEVVDDLQISR